MRLLQRLFNKPDHKIKTDGKRSMHRILAPSVISIFICVVCLCGSSWAWFTATSSANVAAVQSSTYNLSYKAGDANDVEIAVTGTTYEVTSNPCIIVLKAQGTSGATGCCTVQIDNTTYYTEQISTDGTYTFTIKTGIGKTITFKANWGNSISKDGLQLLANGGELTLDGLEEPVSNGENSLSDSNKKSETNAASDNSNKKSGTNDISSDSNKNDAENDANNSNNKNDAEDDLDSINDKKDISSDLNNKSTTEDISSTSNNKNNTEDASNESNKSNNAGTSGAEGLSTAASQQEGSSNKAQGEATEPETITAGTTQNEAAEK